MASEEITAIETVDAPLQNLFGTDVPSLFMERATGVATVLTDVLKKRQLVKRIGNREYVLLEGWTLLGSLLGVFAQVEWTRPIETGWEARAVVRTMSGAVVGSAEAMCSRNEKTWSTRDEYAIRSMSQTRALAKALRMPLGFIVELAGYAATPAEEMPDGLPDLPAPVSKTLTREMVVQRIVDRAKEHDIEALLADVVDSAFEGKTLDDLTKDQLIQLGTDIAAGKYDHPFEQREAGERDTEADPAMLVVRTAGSSGAMTQPPALQPASAAPGAAPADTLQQVLDLTGGELVDEQPGQGAASLVATAVPPPAPASQPVARAGVPAATRSAPASAADGIAERVERARRRAVTA